MGEVGSRIVYAPAVWVTAHQPVLTHSSLFCSTACALAGLFTSRHHKSACTATSLNTSHAEALAKATDGSSRSPCIQGQKDSTRHAAGNHCSLSAHAPNQINLLRRPPFGYEEPSVSPRRSCSALNLYSGFPSAPNVKSWLWSWPVHPCLTPMEPSGWNTCEKLVAPSAMPQSRMAAATAQGERALRNVRALRQGTVEALRAGTWHRIQARTLFSPFFVLGPGRILEEVTRLAILGKVLRTRKHEQPVVRQHRATPERSGTTTHRLLYSRSHAGVNARAQEHSRRVLSALGGTDGTPCPGLF